MSTLTKTLTIAVAGNPNCGKTTIFNGLTGSNQKVGNWPGVTVERIEGRMSIRGEDCSVVDLPGIYALSADSEDEKAARDYLLSGEPDVVINVVDATNIERNLYLSTQIAELDLPMAVVFTMADRLEAEGVEFDPRAFTRETGVPAMMINATQKDELKKLRSWIEGVLAEPEKNPRKMEFSFSPEMEKSIKEIQDHFAGGADRLPGNPRWAAIKILEGDGWVWDGVVEQGLASLQELEKISAGVRDKFGEEADIVLADARYNAIADLASKILKRKEKQKTRGSKIDTVVMHRIWGIPIFLVVMYLVFWVTMSIGGAFIDFFDITFGAVFVDGFSVLLERLHAPGWLIAFLAGGIGTGIQTISTFVPIVFVMFFMLALLEDSGYMARAAFVMDRFMRAIGLPGKAFMPMLVGFGCTVPAIMATRTLENRRDRFLAIFMTPFMSCGARLPVYALFGAAFFGARAGLVVFSIYMAGILLAVLTGLLLKNTLFKGEFSPFVMELPAYHRPRMKMVMGVAGIRLRSFVIRAGKVILIAVTVLSLLNTFSFDGSTGNDDTEDSILSTVSRGITPIFGPMGITGDNWPATVGLFTGLFAKEAVVGTLNSLYVMIGDEAGPAEEEEAQAFSLGGAFAEAFQVTGENLLGIFGGLADPLGTGIISDDEGAVAEEIEADATIFSTMRRFFTPAAAYAYLLFVLLYFPCLAALGAVIRETGAFYGTVLTVYLTLLGWCAATLFYQIAEGHRILFVIIPLAILGLMALSFVAMGKNREKIDARFFK